MKTLQRMLRLDFIPASIDLGLLVLRLWLGLSLLVLHGWGKLIKFEELSGKFADPLGLGTKASLSLAVFGEVVGSILLILGLFTRPGALSCMITMAVAFFLMHNTVLKGSGSGELAFVYMAGFAALFVAGGGRFALDAKVGKSRGENSRGAGRKYQ